jgi:arylsulfatase A-like enzyme
MEGEVLSGYPLRSFDFILARLLKERGLRTAGFVGGPFLKSEFGFSQGFDTYEDTWEGFDQRADQINTKVFRWLGEQWSSPFFLFINYFDPHAPYNPPNSFLSPFKDPYKGDIDFSTFSPHRIMMGEMPPLHGENKQRAIDLYDSEILFMDQHLGHLLEKLGEFELLDHSLLIITSDHGESFGENGIWGHGGLPIESQVRVPLIIHYPPKITKNRRINDQIQTTSIYSTVLKNLGIPLPAFTAQSGFGIDLLRVGEGEENKSPEYTFAERFIPTEYRGMLRSNRWKYLLHTIDKDEGQEVLEWVFDLTNDPQELKNLLGSDKIRDERLRRDYSEFKQKMSQVDVGVKQPSSTTPEEIDEEMRDNLKALGYVR